MQFWRIFNSVFAPAHLAHDCGKPTKLPQLGGSTTTTHLAATFLPADFQAMRMATFLDRLPMAAGAKSTRERGAREENSER